MKITHALAITVLCCAPATALAQESGQPERVYEIGEVETAPLLLNPGEFIAAHDSIYPVERRRSRRRATVELSFVIGRDGVPDSVAIVRSTDRAYDSASETLAKLLRFTPAARDGHPVAVRMRVPMRWNGYTPRTERTSEVEEKLYGNRRLTAEGAPIYDAWEIDLLGELPSVHNRRAFQQELERRLPEIRRQGGTVADVSVDIVIGRQGEITNVAVVSSTDPRFDAATLEAVRILQFEPVLMFGGAVHMVVEQPVQWR